MYGIVLLFLRAETHIFCAGIEIQPKKCYNIRYYAEVVRLTRREAAAHGQKQTLGKVEKR